MPFTAPLIDLSKIRPGDELVCWLESEVWKWDGSSELCREFAERVIDRILGSGDNGMTEPKTETANATLVAAAPDLLGALRECERLLSSFYDLSHDPELEAGRIAARAALAKATARSGGDQ